MDEDFDIRIADLAGIRSLSREELAATLHDLEPFELAALFNRLGDENLADIFAEIHPTDAARVISKLSRGQAADILEEMEPDDAADVVGEMEPEHAEEVLESMEPAEAAEMRDLLAYPSDTAGGIMTPDAITVGPQLTADQAVSALRSVSDQPHRVEYFYVTEPQSRRLLGVISPRELVLATPSARVGDLMVRDVVRVPADADQEEAARLLDQHGLRAIPVVDEEDRLLGVITQDDASYVLLEEAGEDIERLGGSQPLEEPYLRASVISLFRKRVVWLIAFFLGQAYTATILRGFSETMAGEIALTFFIPLLIGMGGNTGSQTVTTLVRAMAVRDISPSDLRRVVWKEVRVGTMMGAILAGAAIALAWALGLGPQVARVVGTSAILIICLAALSAAILPLILRRVRLDPAVVSAPLITTLIDGAGLVIYFTIAQAILHLE